MIRKTTPLTKTAPRRCCQVMPKAARPKAMNAFSPMYGATAIGRFAKTPMRNVPNAAVRIMATVEGPIGIPAAARMAGLTTMMYAMETNVVMPPTTSLRMAGRIKSKSGVRSVLLTLGPKVKSTDLTPDSLRFERDVVDDAAHAFDAVRGLDYGAPVVLVSRVTAQRHDALRHSHFH